jgi:hypothetical protein
MSESVFFNDGRIVEGKVTSESLTYIEIKLPNGKSEKFNRYDVVRIMYNFDYSRRFFLAKKDGSVLDVYIVDETKNSYTYREDLDSAEEVIVPKKDVKSITRDPNLQDGRLSRGYLIRHNSDLIRAGIIAGIPIAGTGGRISPANFVSGFYGDAFPFRYRFDRVTGIDGLVRVQYRTFDVDKPESLGYTAPADCTFSKSSSLKQYSFGAGARVTAGSYAAGCLWQVYALAYAQYSLLIFNLDYSVNSRVSSGGYRYRYHSYGAVAGLGGEISFLPNAGAFAEYTFGYSPSFKNRKNAEGGMLRTGMTFRTAVSD